MLQAPKEFLASDATTRFSSRVQDYVRFRPGYPSGLVNLLANEAALMPDSLVADIGAGTGLLSRTFLDAGYSVVGVEPNREMREAGAALLAGYPRFRSVDGRAEAIPLPDHSVDLAVAGQAFHWFDVPRARTEWVRIFKPDAVAALIWNERHIADAFMQEVEDLIDHYASVLDPDGSIREGGRSRIPAFFAPASFHKNEFPNAQHFSFEGLLGRIASCSFVPNRSDADYPRMEAGLRRIFDRHQSGGEVIFTYQTQVYWGRLPG